MIAVSENEILSQIGDVFFINQIEDGCLSKG